MSHCWRRLVSYGCPLHTLYETKTLILNFCTKNLRTFDFKISFGCNSWSGYWKYHGLKISLKQKANTWRSIKIYTGVFKILGFKKFLNDFLKTVQRTSEILRNNWKQWVKSPKFFILPHVQIIDTACSLYIPCRLWRLFSKAGIVSTPAEHSLSRKGGYAHVFGRKLIDTRAVQTLH